MAEKELVTAARPRTSKVGTCTTRTPSCSYSSGSPVPAGLLL